jgi:hypothetical protein
MSRESGGSQNDVMMIGEAVSGSCLQDMER